MFKKWPVHLFLVPVFFITHTNIRYAGLLDLNDTFFAFLKILAAVFILFFLIIFWLKDSEKSSVITTCCCILILFFGDIKHTLGQIPILRFFSHYKTFLPLLLIVFILILYLIRRSSRLPRITLFLNLLFLLYLSFDGISLIFPGKQKVGLINSEMRTQSGLPKNSRLPDIYYIILDGYPSAGYQREMLGIKNTFLDSSLDAKGFYVINESRSNYSHTALSMASTLGMNYLSGIDTTYNPIPAYHYNNAISVVKKSPFIRLLKETGYSIYNLSIFDLDDFPAVKKNNFLSISDNRIIFYNTIWSCFARDFGWRFINIKEAHEIERKKLKKNFEPQKRYNRQLLDSLEKFEPENSPFFLYAHLIMPHFPYFYDSDGNPYPDEAIYTDSLITDRRKFAEYIGYTNKKAEELTTRILKKATGNDIIIIQSDHSFADLNWSKKSDAFRNFSSFYFPDKDYRQLYDGMSNVNTFRVILNKYFSQQLPLLPDKSFYIK